MEQTTETVETVETTEAKAKSTFQTATEAGRKSLEATGRFMTKVLDFADNIDRWFQLHGGKLKWFMGLSFIVVVIAPIIDKIRGDWRDRWTAYSTAIFFIFLVFLFLAWISSLRDEEGNWTMKRVWARIGTYLKININFIKVTFSKPTEELLYNLSLILIVGSFSLKALQNVSVFFRKGLFMEKLFGYFARLRSFENIINQSALWIFLIGILILPFLYFVLKKTDVLKLLKQDLFSFFSSKKDNQKMSLQLSHSDLIVNAKNSEQINLILKQKNPELYSNFIKALQIWNPDKKCITENDFEEDLHFHLATNIPHSTITRQRDNRIIIDPNDARKDYIPDVVVNGQILIEIKKDEVSRSTTYVYDQVWKYANEWKEKGPVILLFCRGNFDDITHKYQLRLEDLVKVDKKVIAIVATPRQIH